MKEIFSHSFSAELEKNLVGVVTDRGPNMFTTKEKGLSNRLQAKYQDIVVASDFCHSFNLILKEALQKLPSGILSFVKDICSHFWIFQYEKSSI